MVYHWSKFIHNTLLPDTCILCGNQGHEGLDLCPGCRRDLPFNSHYCSRCALPLPAAAPPGSLCGPCQRRPSVYDLCIAPFRYEGPLPHLVTGLKFHARMNHARLLGQLLARALQRIPSQPQPQLIIPIPLHPARLRERGFNQALEIARGPARLLGIPLETRSCLRRKTTAPQSGLDLRARRRNLRQAFALSQPPDARHVVLLDDVVTTGNTVSELAKTLKRAGMQRVDVWAVARTERVK